MAQSLTFNYYQAQYKATYSISQPKWQKRCTDRWNELKKAHNQQRAKRISEFGIGLIDDIKKDIKSMKQFRINNKIKIQSTLLTMNNQIKIIKNQIIIIEKQIVDKQIKKNQIII